MYREMLTELESLAQCASPEDLEVLAQNVLAGLQKMAEADNEGMEKSAILGAAVAALAGGVGAAALASKMPEIQANRAASQQISAYNKKIKADADLEKKRNIASTKLNALYSSMGITPASETPKTESPRQNNFSNKRDMSDPVKRVSTQIGDEARKLDDVGRDINALKTSDWLRKNKSKLLVGGAAAALLANQVNQTKKKESELQGAYGVSGARR